MMEVLISSTVLIAVVLLCRSLLRNRVSHRLQYALWLLVALRLLIPVQFGQSQYSVATLTQQAAQTKPVQQFQQSMEQPVVGPSRTELYQQLLDQYLQQSPAPSQTVPQQVESQIQEEVSKQVTAPSVSQILTTVWICGMVVMGLWFLVTNALFLRRAGGGATSAPKDWASVPVRICPNVPTPCLVGLVRPKICLTPASADDETTRTHVLTHEITHLRHWDHVWAWVRCLCLCVYWFHPLVWVAAILSKRDCELACDEGALKRLGDDARIPYGKTLLATVAQSHTPAHIMETATAMNESKRQLKERVENIVKKPRNLLICGISMILIVAIAAGCAFSGGKPTEPVSPNAPSTESNPQILIDLAHEAEQIVAENQIIRLDAHQYVTEYIRLNSEKFTQAATVTDNTVTLDKEYIQYCIPVEEDVISQIMVDLTLDFQYLTFLDLLMDGYAEAVTPTDIHYDIYFDRLYDSKLFFFPQYGEAGFESIADCYAAIDAGDFAVPEYSFFIRYDTPGIYWASEPDKPLTEETTPPETTLPSEITEPSNTEGPPVDPISPVDAEMLFMGSFDYYSMALQSTFAVPQQLDLSAFFAAGFGEEDPITDEEWALLLDTPGFRRDEDLRRLPVDKMDAVLLKVFGMGLAEFDGVGMERMVYLEKTNSYYIYAPKPELTTIHCTATTPAYMEYTDDYGWEYRVTVDVIPVDHHFEYHITSHTMEESSRITATVELAHQLGMSYVQFLYDSTQFIQNQMIAQGITDPALLQQAATDTMDMYSRTLYLRNNAIWMQFRYLTLGDSDMSQIRSVPYQVTAATKEDTAYRWLFDLSGQIDGAYTESYYPLLSNVLFHDPQDFIRHLTACDADTIDGIGTYLPLVGLSGDEEALYETLLQALSADKDLTEQERATAARLLQLRVGEAQEPEVPYEIQHAIACYASYRAIGTYCYRELNTEDMSRYLTDAQKEIYCQQQMQILCCDTPEEMLKHAHSLLDEQLLTEDPTDRLFTDDEGNLYLIIIPMGTVNYHHIQQVGNNIYYAGAYNENGYIHTVSFTFSNDGKLKEVLPLDANAGDRSHTFRNLTFYLNDFFTVNKGNDAVTFSSAIVEGSLTYTSGEVPWQSSQDYAQHILETRGGQYTYSWVGEYCQEVYYTVLMDEQTTYVHAAYLYGNNVWQFTLQSPTSAGRLAQMIHIATSGIL